MQLILQIDKSCTTNIGHENWIFEKKAAHFDGEQPVAESEFSYLFHHKVVVISSFPCAFTEFW